MKTIQMPILTMSLLGLCLFSGLDAPRAQADFVRGAPVNVRSIIPTIDPAWETPLCLSSDELEMYITSGRPDWSSTNIWVLRRASKDDPWGAPEELGPEVNSSASELETRISHDGLRLYFSSSRSGGYGGPDVYMATRSTRNDPWEQAVNLGPKINSLAYDGAAGESPDGLELYFGSNRPRGYGGFDVYVARRAAKEDPWGDPVNLGPELNSTNLDYVVPLPDGLTIFVVSDRPGGFGNMDWYISRRASVSDSWQLPVNCGASFNTTGDDLGASIIVSYDPPMLWWADSSTWEYYQAPILPIVDFNDDGNIDTDDLLIMIDNWGSSETLCDIGPMPWGDGVVDIEDLKVFIDYWEQENLQEGEDNN